MDLDDVYTFDLESDGLLDTITKIHVLSIGKVNSKGELKIKSVTDYEVMKEFFLNKDITKIGHNVLRYDIPAVDKILGIKAPIKNVIDTLPLSQYLFPELKKHGLEIWGEMLGVAKPKVDDWKTLTIEEYSHRCQEDVKINHLLWLEQLTYLRDLYDNDKEVLHLIKYLAFKADCVRVQEEIGVRFDIEWCKAAIDKLNSIIQPKLEQLASVMPKVEIITKKKRPKLYYNKKGEVSAIGLKWEQFCKEYGVPLDLEEVEYVSGYADPNPNSDTQIKSFLFSLGWVPTTFNTVKNKKTQEQKDVPQIYDKRKGSGEVCDSIVALYEKMPELELLNSLGVLDHRRGLLEGMLESAIDLGDGNIRVYGSSSSITNTLRLKHSKPLVNLPKVTIPYGEEVRGCLINDEGYVLCGADLVNIESVTRNHYLYDYDKEYIETMDDPLFDSHIDIAVLGNMISKSDGEIYVKIDKGIISNPTEDELSIYKKCKPWRSLAKSVNFGATYGSGFKTLAKTGNMSLKQAKELLGIYWQRNWAIKAFADSCEVKNVYGQNWVKNPVSNLWIILRSDKDRFSSVNQSTAVFCFDTAVMNLRKLGVVVQYQVHDEVLFSVPIGKEEEIKRLIQTAMDRLNEQLQLNVVIRMTPQLGKRYSDCH